jgi:hypothetical protein
LRVETVSFPFLGQGLSRLFQRYLIGTQKEAEMKEIVKKARG